MSDYRKDKEKSNKPVYIFLTVILSLMVLFSLSITHPVLLIGMIWDWDIENQLNKANQLAIESSMEEQSLRLTYDNNAESDMRIERAVNLFYNKYGIDNNYHAIEKLNSENFTTVQFTWQIEEEE